MNPRGVRDDRVNSSNQPLLGHNRHTVTNAVVGTLINNYVLQVWADFPSDDGRGFVFMVGIVSGKIQQGIEDVRLSQVFLEGDDFALELRDFIAQRYVLLPQCCHVARGAKKIAECQVSFRYPALG